MVFENYTETAVSVVSVLPAPLFSHSSNLQALAGILKIYKVEKKKVTMDPPTIEGSSVNPGVRSDNEFLQYRGKMSETDLIECIIG